MLLSDINALRRIIRTTPLTELKYNDKYDIDIERMYAGSPVLSEWPSVYPVDHLYPNETEENAKYNGSSKKKSTLNARASINSDSSSTDEDEFFKEHVLERKQEGEQNTPNTNKESDDEDSDDEGDDNKNVSALTTLLQESEITNRNSMKRNGIAITVYLPDYSAMTVYIKPNSTFGDLIKQVLVEHKDLRLSPLLQYNNPEFYEIRMHESDGEPDRDFDPFPNDRPINSADIDEFCLCEMEGISNFEEGGRYVRGNSHADSVFSSSQQTPGALGVGNNSFSNNNGTAINNLGRFSFDEYYEGSSSTPNGAGTGGASSGMDRRGSNPVSRNATRGNYTLEMIEEENGDDMVVYITFPNHQIVDVPIEENTRMIELLLLIKKSHPLIKMKLYGDNYDFCVSSQDQKMLKLMSNKIDPMMLVLSVGTKNFEIQKKVYADSGNKASKSGPSVPVQIGQHMLHDRLTSIDTYSFNDASANAYQEWNVVKRNKFGRKQERSFGVDGKKVYNMKRGQVKGQTSVQRAERDITTIVNIDTLPNDDKTFRITWRDEKDLYNIEYTFETSRACSEVLSKIQYIRKKNVFLANSNGGNNNERSIMINKSGGGNGSSSTNVNKFSVNTSSTTTTSNKGISNK